MAEFHCLDPFQLEQFLERRRASPSFPLELNLAENLVEVLRKANEFVPSAAGSILLDNPTEKQANRRHNSLTFIAAFGERAHGLVGQRIAAGTGIAGHSYLTGRAYVSHDAREDALFYPKVDEETQYHTRSIIAIPIRLGHEVCGVLELINRRGADSFSEHDRNLLEIFAGYISISIENVLDGRKAQEIAKRDNLTGLYNDRYLHIALSTSIAACRDAGRDLAVIFLDLDFFKLVNDHHGHLAGSQVLREVGHLLRHVVRHPEAILARYGGDEFVLAIPGMDLGAAVALSEELRARCQANTFCRQPGDIQPEPLHLSGLTCSVGVATLRRHIADELGVETAKSGLLRAADGAMYAAKEAGRNRVAVWHEVLTARSLAAGSRHDLSA
jgi:diguanylate cyclase (GGDEF)-like protein